MIYDNLPIFSSYDFLLHSHYKEILNNIVFPMFVFVFLDFFAFLENYSNKEVVQEENKLKEN